MADADAASRPGPPRLHRHHRRLGRLAASVLVSAAGDPLSLTVSLVPLAYVLSPTRGPSVYSVLELCLISGLGATAGRRAALAGSILVFGGTILAVGFSPALAPAAAAIALSGIGNAVYSVTNQTLLLEAAEQGMHGMVMAARFSLNQVARRSAWGQARWSPPGCTPRGLHGDRRRPARGRRLHDVLAAIRNRGRAPRLRCPTLTTPGRSDEPRRRPTRRRRRRS